MIYSVKKYDNVNYYLDIDRELTEKENEEEANPIVDDIHLEEFKEYLTSPMIQQDAETFKKDVLEHNEVDVIYSSPYCLHSHNKNKIKTNIDDFLDSFRVVNLDLAYGYDDQQYDSDNNSNNSHHHNNNRKNHHYNKRNRNIDIIRNNNNNNVNCKKTPNSSKFDASPMATINNNIHTNEHMSLEKTNSNTNTIYGNVTAETVKMLSDDRYFIISFIITLFKYLYINIYIYSSFYIFIYLNI